MNSNEKGLIVLNLGSPNSYSVRDVRIYLNEFLMDEKVIDMTFLLRKLLVQCIIVPFRAPKSAHAYRSIWSEKGSPLVKISNDFCHEIEQRTKMPVSLAMRYGNPTPAESLKQLESKAPHLREILIAPMYPHYAMSSYETALEHLYNYIRKARPELSVKVLKPFYNEPAYINALVESIKPFLSKHNYDNILFSYHGLPVRHLKKSDTTKNHCYVNGQCCEVESEAWNTCYKHQVLKTSQLVAQALNLDKAKVKVTFQSRLGSDKWMQPFTDKTLEELPKNGIKKLLVICPAFVADCLETLEEIDMRGKETFINSGGEIFERVPCLNTNDVWLQTFADYCTESNGALKQLWKN